MAGTAHSWIQIAFICIFILHLCEIQLSFAADGCNEDDCSPSPVDISKLAVVSASSTCGENGIAEEFCIKQNTGDCSSCNSWDDTLNHNASYLNDEYSKDTFWKAENFVYPVTLTASLNQKFLVIRHVVSFQYTRPTSMYFSTSSDFGQTWKNISFFASNCLQSFNMAETDRNEVDAWKVQCFPIAVGNTLLTVEFSPLIDLVFNAEFETNPAAQEHLLVTDLKVTLVTFFTPDDPSAVDQSVRKLYYFAAHDWEISGSCMCYGHASSCNTQDTHKCVCEKNTAGVNCEKCLPLFNNKTWQAQVPCEDCGCNNHSVSCEYNETKGLGVCDACADNTHGDKCEMCKPYYFRNDQVPETSPDTCLACGCNAPGISNSPDSDLCNQITGQCRCKDSVTGRACDHCLDGKWNLISSNPDGCEDCGCDASGTVGGSLSCNENSGQCQCKTAVTGQQCNKCKDGFFDLKSTNTEGCTACGCHTTGSVNKTCDASGKCFCRNNFSGDKCTEIAEGYYAAGYRTVTFELEDGIVTSEALYALNFYSFNSSLSNTTGVKHFVFGYEVRAGLSIAEPTIVTVVITLPKTAEYNIALRYKTDSDWTGITLRGLLRSPVFEPFSCKNESITENHASSFAADLSSSKQAHLFGTACLSAGTYVFNVSVPYDSGNGTIILDSLVIVPKLEYFKSYEAQAQTTILSQAQTPIRAAYNLLLGPVSALLNADASVTNSLKPLMAELTNGALACNCDIIGSFNATCDESGQCICKDHVTGSRCDKCEPTFWNISSGQGCVAACSCEGLGSLSGMCDVNTGECSCRQSVIGEKCDKCQDDYYGYNTGKGCSACNCILDYSVGSQCDGESGVCSCKTGINGDKCTNCMATYYNLTSDGCTPCNCDADGSLDLSCNLTTGQCPCKEDTLGLKCSECPSGFFGLSSKHPAGCLQCQCSNKTDQCVKAESFYQNEIYSWFDVFEDRTNLSGWQVLNELDDEVEATWLFDISMGTAHGKSAIKVVNSANQKELFFSAPEKFLGKQNNHMLELSYQMKIEGISDKITKIPNWIPVFNNTFSRGDVLLYGHWFDQPLVSTFSHPPNKTFTQFMVRFYEDEWRVGDSNGRNATVEEMVKVLSNVSKLYIRARWTQDDLEVTSIGDVVLQISNESISSISANNVEDCSDSCPKEYFGLSCEKCIPGYTRQVPWGGAYVDCVPCQCYNHSNMCHPESGVCEDCQHSTSGDNCETCDDGYYGDATQGTTTDCKECKCPGKLDSATWFADACKVSGSGFTCSNCTEGHGGEHCEVCKEKYYGNPQVGKCQLCSCNGNSDLCNTTTGECRNCKSNTDGFSCEWCADEFYGNALNQTCQACQCNMTGSKDKKCNNVTGSCSCKENVEGENCDSCVVNTFNFSSSTGCQDCGCHPNGSASLQCHEDTGICTCKVNVSGDHCDTCDDGYYDIEQGCIPCNCTNAFTNGTMCNKITGQCQCTNASFGGRTCEECNEHAIGDHPNCTLCSTPCYDKWSMLIDVEANRAKDLAANASELLKSFGGKTVSPESISESLEEMELDLEFANDIFDGLQYENSTKDKEAQLIKINQTITKFNQDLDDVQVTINEVTTYLQTIKNFNGTVKVTPSSGGINVLADYKSVSELASSFLDEAVEYNKTGHNSYEEIVKYFAEIKSADTASNQAVQDISAAMERLQEVEKQRQTVIQLLSGPFQDQYQLNNQTLQEISNLSERIKMLVQKAVTMYEEAQTVLRKAETKTEDGKQAAKQRESAALQAQTDAAEAYTKTLDSRNDATSAKGKATEFKEKASSVNQMAQDALGNVSMAINTLAEVSTMTDETKKVSTDTLAQTMPVKFEEIQKLTEDILNTTVDMQKVNDTYDKALTGWNQAKEVLETSKKAINYSQSVLDEVTGIEMAINKSSEYRDEVKILESDSDTKVADIKQVSKQVVTDYSKASEEGENTLTLLNATIEQVTPGLTCFSGAMETAETALIVSEEAFNTSVDAEKVLENSKTSLADASETINSTYIKEMAAYQEIVETHKNATQLKDDVTQAETLLDKYIKQQEQLKELEDEIYKAEMEINEILKEFEKAEQELYSPKCAAYSQP